MSTIRSDILTAAVFESTLQRHAIDVWFPRSLDFEFGGFLCDFNRAWKPCGPHNKLLEFQARQTLFAAEALKAYPQDKRLEQATLHGFQYLRDVMWDKESGGWFHQLDCVGRPLEAHTKHMHGIAYAIHACVAVFDATGEPSALALAHQGFEWLEQYAHDAECKGYFGFLKRDGSVIRDAADCPWKTKLDTIDTPIGFKDLNTHSDLLEALTFLYRASPTLKVQERLAELVDIICDKALTPSGALAYFFQPDWTPIPHLVRFGTEFQTTYRLMYAGEQLNRDEKTKPIARRILHHCLEFAWDRRWGGFFFAGPATVPTSLEGHSLIARGKSWWVQVEALRALLSMVEQNADDPTYANHFAAQWDYIQRHMLDARYGGIYSSGLDHLPRWRARLGVNFARPALTRKGTAWKDASHDGRTWLHCLAYFKQFSNL